jgi:stress response protein YsnF
VTQTMNRVRLDQMRGAPVYDMDGHKIGKVEEIFYDQQTRIPEWIGIGTGFFSNKRVLVPVKGAVAKDDGLIVAYSKQQVQDSPDIDEDEISQQCEADLTAYYGLGYSKQRSQTGLVEGAKRPPTRSGRRGRDEDQAVTRSEEEIEVGKRPVEVGKARLKKWVETEPVALDVELQREVAHVTRERIDQPVGDHDFSEEEVDMPLHREKPVVQKRAVAKERVRLEKDVETEKQTVKDEVKKERVEVEGDVDKKRQ